MSRSRHTDRRPRAARFFAGMALATIVAPTAGLRAQIPDGWAVGAAMRQDGYTIRGGGLTALHPDRGERWQVTGLPADLTGVGTIGNNGASSVLVRGADRRLFAGEQSFVANDTIEIHEIVVVGRKALWTKRHRLGVIDPRARGAQVGELAWLPDGRILVSHFGVTGPALGTSGLAILDPRTGKVTEVPVTGMPVSIAPAAMALAASGTTAFVAVDTANATSVWAVPVPGGGAARSMGQMAGHDTHEIAVDNDGSLLVTIGGSAKGLYRLAASRWTRVTAPGVNQRAAIAVESVTGTYLGRVDSRDSQSRPVQRVERFDRNGGRALVHLLPHGSEVVVDLAFAPGMQTYGPETAGAYRWRVAPNPGGAPSLGNVGFGLTVTATGAAMPGVIALGLQPTDRAVLGIRVLVDGIGYVGALPASPTATLRLPIPTDPSVKGARLYAQAVHARGAALFASKGLRFTAR